MELIVKIHSIADTVVVSDKFKKRDWIVVTDDAYPQHLALQMNQDKCDLLDKFSVGQNVKVSLNLKGRLWRNKEGIEVAFNTLECWRIFEENAAPYNPQPQGSATDAYLNKFKEAPNNNEEEEEEEEEEASDLPF